MEKDRLRKKEIRIKVTDSELLIAKEKADFCEMKVSEMIRLLINDGAIIVYDRINIKELTEALNKIGVNINQIAKHINERGGAYDQEDMYSLLKEFQEMQQLIYAKVWGIK